MEISKVHQDILFYAVSALLTFLVCVISFSTECKINLKKADDGK